MLPAAGPAEAGSAWSQSVMASIRSCPVIDAEGRIYAADSSRLTCHTAGGELLWATNIGFCATGGTALGLGTDGRLQVYLGMRDPPAFVAVDAATGVKRWQLPFSAPVDGAPAVGPDGVVYFGCDDGRIRAVTPAGTVIFEHAVGSPVRSCPALSPDGVIYVVSQGGYLRALAAGGGLLWSRHLGATSNSSPALGPDGLIHAGNDLGEALCFDPDGDLVYKNKIGGPLGWPAVDQWGQARFGSTDRRLYALDGSGCVLWSVPTQGQIRPHMAPLVDPEGRTYFGSADGYLRGVDAHGQVLWLLNLGAEPGALAGASDGSVVAGSLSGMLVRTVPGAAPQPPVAPPQPGPPGAGTLSWPPLVFVPEPEGDAGWHVRHPVLIIDPFQGAAWPEGITLRWEAHGESTESGSFTEGPAEVALSIQGEITVRLWLEGEGLPEEARVTVLHSLRIDTVPPEVRVDLPDSAQWVPAGFALGGGLHASDSGSGLAHVTILLDGLPYDPETQVATGRHVLEVLVLDRAGNLTVVSREFGVGVGCSASPLNPVVVLSGAGYQRSLMGRYVTVMLRVPADVAAAGHPQEVMLGQVPGSVVARLPAASAAGLRLYLARFAREPVEAMLAASANPIKEGRLRRVTITVSWSCGDQPCVATLSLLFRP